MVKVDGGDLDRCLYGGRLERPGRGARLARRERCREKYARQNPLRLLRAGCRRDPPQAWPAGIRTTPAAERVVVRKQLRRSQVLEFFKALPPCLVGIEACATAHYWARELTKLGHQVRLMPAQDVKAYVKRNKSDAADAEAICEAVRRPTMRFVQVKSTEQQGRLMLHRTRDLLMRQRTQLINGRLLRF